MPLSTPVYGWAYLNRNTDPLTYRAVSGEDALLAIESTVSGIDTRLAAAEVDVAALAALTDAWPTYPVTWTSDGTAPSIGNGTLTGRQTTVGKNRWAHISWRAGSTTTFGTGRYFFSLPTNGRVNRQPGTCYIFDPGTANRAAIAIIADTLDKVQMAANTADVGATTPQVFANGDSIDVFIHYEGT